MVSDQHVVFSRSDRTVERNFHAREGQLHTKGIGEVPSDNCHEHSRKHVLQSNDLMISGEEVLHYETLFVMVMFVSGMTIMGDRRLSHTFS